MRTAETVRQKTQAQLSPNNYLDSRKQERRKTSVRFYQKDKKALLCYEKNIKIIIWLFHCSI